MPVAGQGAAGQGELGGFRLSKKGAENRRCVGGRSRAWFGRGAGIEELHGELLRLASYVTWKQAGDDGIEELLEEPTMIRTVGRRRGGPGFRVAAADSQIRIQFVCSPRAD